MQSRSTNRSLVQIIAGAIFASLGNPAVAARANYNPSRRTLRKEELVRVGKRGIISRALNFLNPPDAGKATTRANRSPELVEQLKRAAEEKRNRKNIKRARDYFRCKFYDLHKPMEVKLAGLTSDVSLPSVSNHADDTSYSLNA